MIGGLSFGDVAKFGKSAVSRTARELQDVGQAILPEAKQIAMEFAVDEIKQQVKGGRRKRGAGINDDLLKVQKGLHQVGSVFNVLGLPNPADVGQEIGESIGKPLRKAIKGYGRKKGQASLTHSGDLDFTTKRGDLVYHEKGRDVKKSKQPYSGGLAGDKRKVRGEIVKKVMREKGLSLPQASKYVKEHGLA
jgi:hypothetical protein